MNNRYFGVEPEEKLEYNRGMDMKKQLDEAYNPDRNARREKILVALSGGICSYISAYLLKLQKFDLVGVTVITGWDQSPVPGSELFSCHIDAPRLEEIKEFCHRLGVPHYVVRASSEFQEQVVEQWIGARLTGTHHSPCWSCHDLRLRVLVEKMRELEIDKLATGHFAKILPESTGAYFVHSSNDEENDHSDLLSRLPSHILGSLYLPLADLTKKEVLKLAENFGLPVTGDQVKVHQCLPWREEFLPYLEKTVPAKFLGGGNLWFQDEEREEGTHDGVVLHSYGDVLSTTAGGRAVLAGYKMNEKKLILRPEAYLYRNRVLLRQCKVSEGTPLTEPGRGVLCVEGQEIECWYHPKCLDSVFVEWEEELRIPEGTILALYKKKGKNAKVFLTGKVRYLPKIRPPEEGEQSVPKADYARDF